MQNPNARMRRKTAAFPSGKTFSSWRSEESSVPAATQNALATLEWIGRAENLVIAGPSGTGKSHLVEALAHAAIEKDLRVAWFTLETLTAAIGKAKADGSVARTVTRICRSDLVVVDDIGMLPAGQDAAEAFYRITDAAYERRAIAVTSNIHPSKAHMFTATYVRRCRKLDGFRPAWPVVLSPARFRLSGDMRPARRPGAPRAAARPGRRR